MEKECIFLSRIRPKANKYGSYDYVDEGRPGNPKSIHPVSFLNSKGMYFPIGFTLRLLARDNTALQELRNKSFAEARWKDGYKLKQGDMFQVRRNYFGGNQGQSNKRKLMHSLGMVETRPMGAKIIIREFKV